MKIIKTILSSTLSISLLLSTPIYNKNSNIYAVNKNEIDILNAIKNHDHITDIEKIEFDSKGEEVKSVENVNTNSRTLGSLNLQDGTYLIDRGDGWVLGNDESFVESQFGGPGEYTRLSKGKTVGTIQQVMSGTGVSLDLNKVKLAVQASYGRTIVKEDNLIAGFGLICPKDKNIYAKTYITYRRYDMIKIKNDSLDGYTSTYEPNGTWLKYVLYDDGELVDQNALKEKVCRNVLNEPELLNIRNSISVSGCDYIKNLDIVFNNNTSTLDLVNRSNHPIHKGFGSQKYFSIELRDGSTNEVKASISMNGNDCSNDSKFDSFDRVKYNIGDILKIYHKEPYLLNMFGSVYGDTLGDPSQQSYRITKYGLEAIN